MSKEQVTICETGSEHKYHLTDSKYYKMGLGNLRLCHDKVNVTLPGAA